LLAPAPLPANPPAPVQQGGEVGEHAERHPAHHRTQQKRLPQRGQLVGDPFEGQFVGQRARRDLHQPGAGHVGDEEHRWHGQRVGQPDQADGNRQVAAHWNRQRCGQQHLHGDGDQRREQANPHGPRHRVAVEVPEVRVMQQLAEKA